ALIAAAALVVSAATADAQLLVPFLAKAGIKTATTKAKDSLGADAHLTSLAAFGNLQQGGFTLEFNLETGEATAWGYTFYSPTQSAGSTIGVVQLPIIGFQTQSLGNAVQLPAFLNGELDTTGAYSNSDQMIAQLKTDTAFMRYRSELPGAKPQLVTLGQL